MALHQRAGFIGTGIVFAVLLFTTEQWRRIVPTSPRVVQQALGHLVTLRGSPYASRAERFLRYNALQQIAYCSMVFISVHSRS